MKLIFRKHETEQVSVLQVVDGAEQPFSYTDMVKDLMTSKSLEPPEIAEGFSAEEAASIRAMIEQINAVMADEAGDAPQ